MGRDSIWGHVTDCRVYRMSVSQNNYDLLSVNIWVDCLFTYMRSHKIFLSKNVPKNHLNSPSSAFLPFILNPITSVHSPQIRKSQKRRIPFLPEFHKEPLRGDPTALSPIPFFLNKFVVFRTYPGLRYTVKSYQHINNTWMYD